MTTQAAVRDRPSPFMFDRSAECMPRTDLAALQLDRLKKTLERAYARVPHFRKAFDAARVTADSVKSLDDLRRFPFTLKTDLRDNYPFGMFAVPREQVLRVHASSGTTGRPTVVGYTRRDLDLWSDLMARSLACAGARPGDIVHNAYGYGLFTGGLGALLIIVLIPARSIFPWPRRCVARDNGCSARRPGNQHRRESAAAAAHWS